MEPMVTRPTDHTASTRFTPPPSRRLPGMDELFDPSDDLVHVERRRVDLDRVLGRSHVDRVLLVAQAKVGRECVRADSGTLRAAARGPHRLVRDEVDLYLGLRCDDGAD